MHNLGKYKGMIEIINEPESNGSFEAIRNACYHVVDLNSNVFLNWSDIIPISKIKNTSYDTNIIFTNKSNHRFAINNNTITFQTSITIDLLLLSFLEYHNLVS